MCIGWHFFFEGVGKVKSAYAGKVVVNETPFSSEAYFRESESWLGKKLKQPIEVNTKIPGKNWHVVVNDMKYMQIAQYEGKRGKIKIDLKSTEGKVKI